MPQFQTFRPNFPPQQRSPKVRKRPTNRPNVINFTSIKFGRLCFLKSKKLLIPPLCKSKRCEQKLMLSVAFTWTQMLITGMK